MITVELVSPEDVVFTGEASLVIARTPDGEIGFQPGHVPFVGTLVPDLVRCTLADGSVQVIAVHSGFIELAADRLTILSDVAELGETIDPARAQRALERAEEALRADPDDAAAAAAKARAEVRLRGANAPG